jgi:hypothetical protein
MATDLKIRMRGLAGALVIGTMAAAQISLAQAQSQAAGQIFTAGCADDVRKFCSNVTPGGGRIIACLKQNQYAVSDKCKQAAAQASRMAAGGAQNAAPAAPPTGSSTSSGDATNALTSAPNATPPASTGTSGASGSSGAKAKPARTPAASVSGKAATDAGDGSYLVMKKVQITGFGPDPAHANVPAFDLMIPSTWKIQGGVKFGGGPTGCFADIFALSLQASSADQSIVFGAGPDSSWHYADDPSALKNLTDPNRRQPEVGGKPCPVAKPMKAEEYIRQNILKLFPSGTTVVSVAPFPELNAIVRKRQGLPPGDGTTGAARSEAVRMRLAYQKDGKDVESWVAVAVVVNVYPAGRGSFYDSHATSLVSLTAPKGKLDANDKLFQVIVSWRVIPAVSWRSCTRRKRKKSRPWTRCGPSSIRTPRRPSMERRQTRYAAPTPASFTRIRTFAAFRHSAIRRPEKRRS